jgi:hypothetical protein
MTASPIRPASASSIWLTSASALLMVGVLLWMTSSGFDAMTVLVACLLAMALPIGIVDVVWNRFDRRRSAGLDGPGTEPLPFGCRASRSSSWACG